MSLFKTELSLRNDIKKDEFWSLLISNSESNDFNLNGCFLKVVESNGNKHINTYYKGPLRAVRLRIQVKNNDEIPVENGTKLVLCYGLRRDLQIILYTGLTFLLCKLGFEVYQTWELERIDFSKHLIFDLAFPFIGLVITHFEFSNRSEEVHNDIQNFINSSFKKKG